MTANDLDCIRSLMGEVSPEQLRYVECFTGTRMALFVPAVGPCFYAVTPDHYHPAYSFILNFDDQTVVAANGTLLRSEPGTVMAIGFRCYLFFYFTFSYSIPTTTRARTSGLFTSSIPSLNQSHEQFPITLSSLFPTSSPLDHKTA